MTTAPTAPSIIRLADLASKKALSIAALRKNLSQKGFSVINVDDILYQQYIQAGLNEASCMPGFRFPPIDNDNSDDDRSSTTKYNESKRRCFQTLFNIGATAFEALAHNTPLPTSLQNALQNCKNITLFGPNFDSDEPFSVHSSTSSIFDNNTDDVPFGHSFFNLFSYDSGMLNSHIDRGLVTVIAAKVPPPPPINDKGQQLLQRSALWVKAPKATPNEVDTDIDSSSPKWFNIDNELYQHQQKEKNFNGEKDENVCGKHVVILLGQDCEKLNVSKIYSLHAAEHSVRVDPDGDFVSRSHYRSDPATTTATTTVEPLFAIENRVSAALILRHDLD